MNKSHQCCTRRFNSQQLRLVCNLHYFLLEDLLLSRVANWPTLLINILTFHDINVIHDKRDGFNICYTPFIT